MTQTEQFILKMKSLKKGERSRLRRLSGAPLAKSLLGFDLFTGLWWPLRRQSPAAPRKETSWLVALLFGSFSIPHVRPEQKNARPTFPIVLGGCEPVKERDRKRYRRRFDILLQTPLSGLEPHLRWGLSVVANAVEKGRCSGLDWAQLLEDLSIWDRGEEHRRARDIRDVWAENYLNAVQSNQRR